MTIFSLIAYYRVAVGLTLHININTFVAILLINQRIWVFDIIIYLLAEISLKFSIYNSFTESELRVSEAVPLRKAY